MADSLRSINHSPCFPMQHDSFTTRSHFKQGTRPNLLAPSAVLRMIRALRSFRCGRLAVIPASLQDTFWHRYCEEHSTTQLMEVILHCCLHRTSATRHRVVDGVVGLGNTRLSLTSGSTLNHPLREFTE
ncbi:hypothetical protein PYCCODRAFT_1132530 [Trametes coccinea BRFM310]|uniref:Uncharacterized protein n=1 Tax=Trametes coccinea (strain BRFM310) TaxID=1353009 RepID=A0A1Y2I8R3_TRAC3|nr:hypothetical protein PYCCODRAFT_1132530 [Trametes coccinea BRFM310]